MGQAASGGVWLRATDSSSHPGQGARDNEQHAKAKQEWRMQLQTEQDALLRACGKLLREGTQSYSHPLPL